MEAIRYFFDLNVFVLVAKKNHYATKDPITILKKYIFENNLVNEAELKAIDKKIDESVEESVEFAVQAPFQLVTSC